MITATNRDLEEEIAGGRFREDLYYRLNVVNLQLPPLRERGDDVIVLARFLLSRYAARVRRQGEGLLAQRHRRDAQARVARQRPRAREPHQEGDRALPSRR
jgi:transcriptional regulator with GAF, ATPase, and Fis domain